MSSPGCLFSEVGALGTLAFKPVSLEFTLQSSSWYFYQVARDGKRKIKNKVEKEGTHGSANFSVRARK